MSACHPCRLDEPDDLEKMDSDAAVSPSTVASVTVSPPPFYRASGKTVTFGDQVLVRFYECHGLDRQTLEGEEKKPSPRLDEAAHSGSHPAGVVLDTDTVVKSFDGHSSRVVQAGGAASQFTDLGELRQLAISMGERPRPSVRNRSRTCATDLISFMLEEDSRPRYRRGGGRRRFYSEGEVVTLMKMMITKRPCWLGWRRCHATRICYKRSFLTTAPHPSTAYDFYSTG
ncbi:hypothetical protein FOZ63_001726 [Perkinsus olseni]|uniref:Uncharacterized protein n=1 Tax=Perkinsus olseni TaxID=32597 RepID=A0A7J6S8M1_PEROL|nr:hypothetical protein FOZ63_001726 [Perkinsus olseni]